MSETRTIAGFEFKIKKCNFWVQKDLEEKFRDLYIASLPKASKFSEAKFRAFVQDSLATGTQDILEVTLETIMEPMNGGPRISEVLNECALTGDDVVALSEITDAFSKSSGNSGPLQTKYRKPSNGSRPLKKTA